MTITELRDRLTAIIKERPDRAQLPVAVELPVFLGDNSTPPVKERWRIPETQQIVTALVRWLEAGREEAEDTERRAKTTDYTTAELTRLHVAEFSRIAAGRPRGNIVGDGWVIRISVGGVSLVTWYSVRQADGTWKKEESLMAL